MTEREGRWFTIKVSYLQTAKYTLFCPHNTTRRKGLEGFGKNGKLKRAGDSEKGNSNEEFPFSVYSWCFIDHIVGFAIEPHHGTV